MGILITSLLEITAAEVLIFIFLLIGLSKSKRKKNGKQTEDKKMKVETKKAEKRSMKEKEPERLPKKTTFRRRTVVRRTAEFKRFLAILIPLIIIGYVLFESYFGNPINLTTLILILAGIIIFALLIFHEILKRY
jgi:hypothetical protein